MAQICHYFPFSLGFNPSETCSKHELSLEASPALSLASRHLIEALVLLSEYPKLRTHTLC